MARFISSVSDLYGGQATAQNYGSSSQTVAAPIAGTGGNGVADNSQAGIPITQLFAGWYGSILAAPLLWLFGLIGVLIAYKLLEEHLGGREIFAEVKIGLNNWVKIGIMATSFIVIAKLLLTRYQVPGLSSVVQAA